MTLYSALRAHTTAENARAVCQVARAGSLRKASRAAGVSHVTLHSRVNAAQNDVRKQVGKNVAILDMIRLMAPTSRTTRLTRVAEEAAAVAA